jgi:transcriptional regulator with XRE-family HTH domain
MEEVGNRIQRARVAAGLTQEEAATRAGIDYKRWQKLEQGQVNATLRTLVCVADAVETTFWDLLAM